MPKMLKYGALKEFDAIVMIDKIVRIAKGDRGIVCIHLDNGDILETADSVSELEHRILLLDREK